MQDFMVLKQLMGGDALFSTALFAGLWIVVLYRREAIVIPGFFRIAVFLFALSIALPPFAEPIASFLGGGPMLSPMYGGGQKMAVAVLSGCGPLLQAISLLCAFTAVMPRTFAPPQPAAPQKHPLD